LFGSLGLDYLEEKEGGEERARKRSCQTDKERKEEEKVI